MKHLMLYEEWCATGKLDGDLYPIDEGWVSDLAHIVGDVASAVADVSVPGSGAVLDVIHMLSYFVEADLTSDSVEKTKLIISGIIQGFAIFEPVNAVAVGLKKGVREVFSFFSKKTPEAAAIARVAAKEVDKALTLMLNGLQGFASKITTSLSSSKFATALKWLSNKLGITNAINWVKTFITQKIGPLINSFLVKLRDTFNPKMIGATTPTGEFNAVLAKNAAKLMINQDAGDWIHSKVDKTASDWYAHTMTKPSGAVSNAAVKGARAFQPANRIYTDATYVAPKPYLKGII